MVAVDFDLLPCLEVKNKLIPCNNQLLNIEGECKMQNKQRQSTMEGCVCKHSCKYSSLIKNSTHAPKVPVREKTKNVLCPFT
jgi:hypothetical protein